MNELYESLAALRTASGRRTWKTPAGNTVALELWDATRHEGPSADTVLAFYPDAIALDGDHTSGWCFAGMRYPVKTSTGEWDEDICAEYPERAAAARAAYADRTYSDGCLYTAIMRAWNGWCAP